jgi:hypothetical protein
MLPPSNASKPSELSNVFVLKTTKSHNQSRNYPLEQHKRPMNILLINQQTTPNSNITTRKPEHQIIVDSQYKLSLELNQQTPNISDKNISKLIGIAPHRVRK